MMSILAPVQAPTLKDQVARLLCDAIFAGELQPGQVLRELPLARKLNVSQATVREALAELEQWGLVLKIPNRGTTVTNLSTQEVRERLAVRLTLEQMAAVQAARRMREPEFAELEQLAARISAGIERNAYFEVSQADLAFHRCIWEHCGNRTLAALLTQVSTPLFAFLGLLHKKQAKDQRATKPHTLIIEALRTRRAATIREAIRYHLEGSYGALLESEAEDLLSFVRQD